jgi:hypothetical protein
MLILVALMGHNNNSGLYKSRIGKSVAENGQTEVLFSV